MARYSEHDTAKIYQAADAFRTNCLLRDGSLLFADPSVWRSDVLDLIHKAFVAAPDEGDRTFIWYTEGEGRSKGSTEPVGQLAGAI